ncbi:MAG: DUF3311 domain-containing protein [Nocardioidaceae bacterium]
MPDPALPDPAPADPSAVPPAAGPSATRPVWTVVGVLLAVGILLPLLVGLYDQATPTLLGFPFYYWFQFLLIPVVSVLTFTAFRFAQGATRRDREARGLKGDPR